MTAKRIGLLTAALLIAAVGGVVYLHPLEMDPWHRRSLFARVTRITDAAVGATEAELRAVYGEPLSDEKTAERLRTLARWLRFDGKPGVPTRRRIFQANRALVLVFLEQRGQEWVCTHSSWTAGGHRELFS